MRELLTQENDVVALIKPQFEAKKEQVGEGGIVRDPEVHLEVLERIIGFAESEDFLLHGITYSPIKGTQGNIEFLAHFKYQPGMKVNERTFDLKSLANSAHHRLLDKE